MSGYYLLLNGEFAYNKSYSVGFDFGSIKRFDRYPMGALSTLYICFSVKNYDSDFIKTYFDSLKWYKEIYMIAAEGARNHGLLNVPTEDFFATRHTLPTNLKEQKKIAAFMKLLERRIDAQRRLVENLKSYKRGVSTAIFTESLHIGSKSKWQEFSLGDFCTVVMGQSPDSTTYNSDGLGLPLVQGNADICEGITQPQHFTSAPTKIATANSILLSVRAPVGSVSIANQTVCIGRGVCSITSENMDFLYQLLVHIQDKWKKIEQGGTFTAISGDDIRRFRVNIPCVSDQIIVGRFLGAIDHLINQNKAICVALSKLKSAFLQILFI